MTRTDTSEGQTLGQPGGTKEDSHFCEGDRHFNLVYDKGYPGANNNINNNSNVHIG